jgi:O-antigen ligase
MGLPLTLGGALWAWRSGKYGGRAAVKTVVLLAGAGAMMLAIVVSLSRMGFLAALGSLVVTAMLAVSATEMRMFGGEKSWRWVVPALLVVALAGWGFIYLPTDELISRFATLAQTDDINQDTRAEIWKQSLPLVAAFPITGTGLGTYESAFRRYKNVAPGNTVDFAHNDYLQALAEVGLIGFAIGAALLLRVLGRVLRVVVWHKETEYWELSLGVTGAIIAMLLHSLVDFNMYIPTNAMMLGWICGIGASLAVRAD